MTCEDKNHQIMIESWHYSLNMSKNVCARARASYAKVCKLGQSKKKIKIKKSFDISKSRNMIIPTIFVLNGIQSDTQKYLRDILSWTWYAHTTQSIVQCIRMKNKHIKYVEQAL